MFTRCFRVFTPAAALALGAASLIGCTADRHTFSSTAMAPKSVDITYIQSGETAWSYDIPPGQKLIIECSREGQFNGFKVPNTPAEEMKWYISSLKAGNDLSGHPGKFGAQSSGQVEFTGAPIQINLRLRDPKVDDNTPAPIEVVPAPPAFEEADETPAPPAAMDDLQDAEPQTDMLEESADDAGDAMDNLELDPVVPVADEAEPALTK